MKLYDNLIACTSAKHFECIMKLNAPTYLSLSLSYLINKMNNFRMVMEETDLELQYISKQIDW